MAFTAYFCTSDTPWIGGNGLLGIGWVAPDTGVFSVSITGVTALGASFNYSTTTTVNTGNVNGSYAYGKALKAGTYTVVVTEFSTSITQSFSFVISDYPEVFTVNCTPVQPSCSQTTGYVSFGYDTGQFSTMQYCVHEKFAITIPSNCNCGAGNFSINKGQITTSCLLTPGIYQVFLENNSVGCSFNIPGHQPFGIGGIANSGYCEFTINPPSQVPLNITASSVDTICNTSVGTITIDTIDGTGPYSFSWTGPNGFVSTNQNLSGLEAGAYTLVVTDANGCTGTITITIASLPDQNGCGGNPITCYKFVNCDPDCFGTSVIYVTGADVSPLLGYVVNGLQIEGEVIDPTDCWTVEETDPSESEPEVLPCYTDFDIGNRTFLRNCTITINGTNIYAGNPIQSNTTAFVSTFIGPGGASGGFVPTAGSTPTMFSLCAPSWTYSNANLTVGYEWFDSILKNWIPVQITVLLGTGSPAKGCYAAQNFQGYNTVFSTCELCKPVECPVEPPYVRIIQDPVKIFYQIREPKCDITATKQFATAYSNMIKKIKYGIADCCSGLNIAETWVNKQISDLQATIIPGYNCRSLPMDGCAWLPLQGCELLVSPTDGTSILVIAGEDLVYAKLVMLLNDGKAYLNQPLDPNNYQRAIGFTTMDVQMNHSTRVLVNGIITNPAWSLVTGAIYYAAPNGNITTAVPNTGISQAIGIAINPTTLFVDIKQPNILC
jgi:hypothetical protein